MFDISMFQGHSIYRFLMDLQAHDMSLVHVVRSIEVGSMRYNVVAVSSTRQEDAFRMIAKRHGLTVNRWTCKRLPRTFEAFQLHCVVSVGAEMRPAIRSYGYYDVESEPYYEFYPSPFGCEDRNVYIKETAYGTPSDKSPIHLF